ncbi:MAG: hypothetical protein EXX96DRAFT_614716 [Benjaminiella poitrasii]|nr:MAG: hypothetical protein EXX96DRAFT_614716 [Benjaminiella poitrasii]
MPVTALRRLVSYVSQKWFYTLGVHIASRPFPILFFSLLFICLLSYPTAIDDDAQMDPAFIIDAHPWQLTKHIRTTHSDASFMIHQIRVVSPTQTITKEFIDSAFDIYQSLTVAHELQQVCQVVRGRCWIVSPFVYWNESRQALKDDDDLWGTINAHQPFTTFGNVTWLGQKVIEADSIIMTVVLNNQPNAQEIWNHCWKRLVDRFPDWIANDWMDIPAYRIQFKLKYISQINVLSTIGIITTGITLFIYLKLQFRKFRIIKSTSELSVAVLFLSCSTYAMTRRWSPVSFAVGLAICTAPTLQQTLWLTTAVCSEDKVRVQEKIGRGLEEIGMSMTTTLWLEWLMLGVAMVINSSSFCVFVALVLGIVYTLTTTLFVAFLAIDIKRAELSDLNRHKRAVTPIKIYKMKKITNILILFVTLILFYVFGSDIYQANWTTDVSRQFWHTLNPTYTPQIIEVYAPQVFSKTSLSSTLHDIYRIKFDTIQDTLTSNTWVENIHPFWIHVILPSILILSFIIALLIPATRARILHVFRMYQTMDSTHSQESHQRQVSVRTFMGAHISDLHDLASSSTDTVASIDQEGQLVLWDARRDDRFVLLESGARCVATLDQWLVAGFQQGRVTVWRTDTAQLVQTWQTPLLATRLYFLDPTTVISIHRDGLYEWRVGRKKAQHEIREPHIVTTTCVSTERGWYVVMASRTTMTCWQRFVDGRWQELYRVAETGVVTMAAEDHELVTGSHDGAVKVWQLETGSPVCVLSKGHQGQRYQRETDVVGGPLLQFSDFFVDRPVGQTAHHHKTISQVAVSHCCRGTMLVASCSTDDTVHVWRLETGDDFCQRCQQRRRLTKKRIKNKTRGVVFLGEMAQRGGRGVVFCDDGVLAGVRQTAQGHWQAWLTTWLQSYEPSQDVTIPTTTIDLESKTDEEELTSFDEFLLRWGIKKVAPRNVVQKEEEEAYELLPFSTVRHVVASSKSRLCCDFGNFVKCVSFDTNDKKQ